MYKGNNHLVITFNSEGMKLDISPNGNGPYMEETAEDSDIILSKERGMRINFIRLVYGMCKKQFFTKKNGGKASDMQVFQYLGSKLGVDLTDYCNDLNRAMQDNTALEKNLRIFDELQDVMRDKFNSM